MVLQLAAPLVAWSTFLYAVLLLVIVLAMPGGIAEILDFRTAARRQPPSIIPRPDLLPRPLALDPMPARSCWNRWRCASAERRPSTVSISKSGLVRRMD